MIKRVLQSALRNAGFELRRIRAPLPAHVPLNVFDFCAQDLMRSVDRPFALQIGANDGIRADPLRNFVTQHRWNALLIEPLPTVYKQLQRNYEQFPWVQTRNIAVSDRDGMLSLYVPSDELVAQRPDLTGLCSLERKHVAAELIREGLSNPMDLITEIAVPAKTVPGLLQDEGISRIDVLQIDTEGHDWRILSQFDLSGLDVKLINMEFFHLTYDERHACVSKLTELGYTIAFYLGDLVAYREPQPG